MKSKQLRVMGQLEGMSHAERLEIFMALRCVLPAGTLKADQQVLRALVAAYLLEFGGDGYDVQTFVDWCLAGSGALGEPAPGQKTLAEWYEERAAQLRAEWKATRGNRAPVHDMPDLADALSQVPAGAASAALEGRDLVTSSGNVKCGRCGSWVVKR